MRPPNRRVLALGFQARALFGVGFFALGAVALYRVVVAAAPAGNKVIGAALGVAMIALGVFRIVQYLRWKREGGPPA